MAKEEGIKSRPDKDEDLELAHWTKIHCADWGNFNANPDTKFSQWHTVGKDT